MDIRYLEYFVEIVNSKFNLSLASKKLMISQPALSQIIKSFEIMENLQLFERYKGRLRDLTPSGRIFYKNALILIENYHHMMEELRETAGNVKGKIRIGIPPLILGIAFSEIISVMIAEHPEIEFEIIEAGSVELRKALMSKDLDLAVLVQPTEIASDFVNEFLVQESELTAFMSEDNPLAKKSKIHWSDLNDQFLAIFDSNYAVHHWIVEHLSAQNVNPKKTITSGNWDFLLMCTKKSAFITVFPSPIKNIFLLNGIQEVYFHDPIPWKVIICQTKKKRYSKIEKYVLKSMVEYFG